MHRVFSPAKINLFLKVLNKRSDGYHEIITLLQTIDLGDWITFSPASSLQLTLPDLLPQGQDNLICRAAMDFYAAAGISPAMAIAIEKNIPMEAGLGGGSSNAAVTLRTLNTLHGSPLSYQQLSHVAAGIGSDVPFFLRGGTAWGTGRGEVIVQEPDLPPFWLRIIKPSFGLSTAHVYGQWEEPSPVSWDLVRRALSQFRLQDLLSNDLEPLAVRLRPEILELKKRLLQDGAVAAMLSGSGSAVFGVYYERPDALCALGDKYEQWLVKTVPAEVICREEGE